MKLNKFAYLFKEGVKSIFTHGFMSFACIVVIAACLLIMGNFALLALNVDYNIELLEQENEILAFVDEDLSEEEAREILPYIKALDNVSEVEFVTREEAMERFLAEQDEEDQEMFSDLSASVFRHRYMVYLEDQSLMGETTAAIAEVDGIADVSASLELSQGFIVVRNIVSIVSVILIIILFIVSILIMQNTIKLATFSRRDEIGIMKMVGASNGFIRCPFVIEGLLLGLLGALIAFFLQWGIYSLATDGLAGSTLSAMISVISFHRLMLPVLLVFLAISLLVGTFGSNIAIRNYLKV